MLATMANPGHLDVMVIVVEPYPRSGEVARRLLDIAADKGGVRSVVVANKIKGEADLEAVRGFLKGAQVDFVIPADDSVVRADAEGRAPLDVDPTSPAVTVVRELAASLGAHSLR